MRLADWSLRFYRLPYRQTIHWANAVENAGLYALLTLRDEMGHSGHAEGTVKATWSGVSPAMLKAAFRDLLIPRLTGIPLDQPAAVAGALADLPENRLGKGMIETACRLLDAAAADQPLWKHRDGQARVEVSWTLTRQPPARMLEEALLYHERYGLRSFKVKGGQGFETDRAVLRALRDGLPRHCRFVVDANSHYAPEQALAYLDLLAEYGVEYAEDPCPLESLPVFEALQKQAPLPILIDRACTTRHDAERFLQAGARALSTKPGRIGMGEAERIRDLAVACQARTTVGIYAESALGTLINLQFAATCPTEQEAFPAEQTFYLGLLASPLRQPLDLRDGAIHLPDHGLANDDIHLEDIAFLSD